MKELSIEEKAKRYDEAIEKVRAFNKRWQCIQAIDSELALEELKEIFPELKESEDEQSKKWILEYLYDGLRKSDEQFKGQFKAAITWFEKQCKWQYPKFRMGDTIKKKYGRYCYNLRDRPKE